jgi:FdhD protein
MWITRWDGEVAREVLDEVVIEEPLEIRIGSRGISVTMRTPGHDGELAAGFLLTEGIIHKREDVLAIKHCVQNRQQNVLNVFLAEDVDVDFQQLTRHVFASSSCGLCGKATIDAIHAQFPPVQSNMKIDPDVLTGLPQTMRAAQSTFDRTGGLHAAALFDTDGRMIVLREDVGRHNAVDKLVGHCLLNGLFPVEDKILVVSGRTSFEIMQKALAARIPIVAAISAPSSLAVEFAEKGGQTLIGFLREGRMNVYAHPDRVGFGQDVGAAPQTVGSIGKSQESCSQEVE